MLLGCGDLTFDDILKECKSIIMFVHWCRRYRIVHLHSGMLRRARNKVCKSADEFRFFFIVIIFEGFFFCWYFVFDPPNCQTYENFLGEGVFFLYICLLQVHMCVDTC